MSDIRARAKAAAAKRQTEQVKKVEPVVEVKPPSEPVQGKRTGRASPVPYVIMGGLMCVLIVFIGIILVYGGRTPAPETAVSNGVSGQSTGGKWRVTQSTSSFDDTSTVAIALTSDTSVRAWLDTVTPALVLRCKERKLEAYVDVKTQLAVEIDDDFNQSPTVRIRFDSDKAYTLRTGESTDGEAVFFDNAESIIQRMETADTMIFGFTPYNANPGEAVFDLRGLKDVSTQLWNACKQRR